GSETEKRKQNQRDQLFHKGVTSCENRLEFRLQAVRVPDRLKAELQTRFHYCMASHRDMNAPCEKCMTARTALPGFLEVVFEECKANSTVCPTNARSFSLFQRFVNASD